MSTSPPSPVLVRLKKQAVKRFHPDNAVDKEDEIRLTRLMQAALAAFDARDEAALRAVFAPPQPFAPAPQPPPNAWGPRTYQTPPRAAQSQQQPPVRTVRTFKSWFWLSWLPWGVLWIATDLNPSWDKAGVPVVFFLLGLIVSFFVAANRTKLWSSGRWKPHLRVGVITAVAATAFVFLCWVIETMKSQGPVPRKAHAQEPTTSPENDSTSFTARYGWYVDAIKRQVAHNWYLKEVDPSTPVGATVYLAFTVGKTGYHNAPSLKTSSGYYSLDRSCINAVERVNTFGPLPAGYGEQTLNVLYHCTYPGTSK